MLGEFSAEWRSLDPKVRILWLAQGAITGLVLIGFSLPGEFLIREVADGWPLPFGTLALGLLLLFVVPGLILIGRRYVFWRYRLRDDDLAVAFGVFWRTQRFIARPRIQHVDVTSGPIARALGLADVSIYVGGQLGAAVTIPGLENSEAERLRATLIRIDPPASPLAPPPVVGG